MYQLRNPDLILAELSFAVIGACFDAFNAIGPNQKERQYQRAVAQTLTKRNIRFVEQIHCPVRQDNKKVAAQYLDFLIEDKLVLELKVADRFRRADFDQANAYLATTGLNLALLVRFNFGGVTTRRVIRI